MTNLRTKLFGSTILIGAALFAMPVAAQTNPTIDTPEEEGTGEIVVTGSRIVRSNDLAPSPIVQVTGEQVVAQADITLDTFLNTLPQVNPAGTTTSNNPGNGGQSNIDLRGLGSNRNLVLINGRRPMVSSSAQAVDLNTIPQGLIDRIEVVTGGAGAAYGADAVAGVVNLILKENFSGVDLRATYSNSVPLTDAREYQISGVIGGNFADGRGNMSLAVEYAERQGLIKAQRPFAAQATATTGSFPTGRYTQSGANPISQTAINALFARYGVAAAQTPNGSQLGFNSDGSLFGVGVFNNPLNVANFRYGLDSPANPNLNFFPDFYSYNFDIVNILVLPLERKSAFLKGNYEVSEAVEFFVQAGYTDYSSSSALAPTPVGVALRAPGQNTAIQASSSLIAPGGRATGFVIPLTNPFISADLRGLLATRTGDDPNLVGSGPSEPVNIGYRFLGTGLRTQTFENQVVQGLAGVRGQFAPGWRYEAYYSWGETTIDQIAAGNVNVQRVQSLLEAADGGASLCAGGFNPFGIQPLSQACVDFVAETGRTSTVFTQKVGQAFISGELAQLPAGALTAVAGVEKRDFRFEFDPGALFGPIAGFNTSTPSLGTNEFFDVFGELLVPIARDSSFADSLELSLTGRYSRNESNDIQNNVSADPSHNWAYGANLTWAIVPELRLRGSYQHTVRAPNFGELFDGGGSFPQIFDPCSAGTAFRSRGAAATALCTATGVGATTIGNFAATPGAQAFLTIAGNPRLRPEEADTFTVGAVFNKFGFYGSIDYYNIALSNTIFAPDVNEIIASCYGYNDINPTLAANNPYCQSIVRAGNNIVELLLPTALGGNADGASQTINQGNTKTSGLDFQLGYRLPTEFINPNSALNFNLLVNYLIDFKVDGLGGLRTDYAGTASYFGAGLGTSFPRWRGTLNANLAFTENLAFQTRVRYIADMENRAARQFVGETFDGPGEVFYFDFALETTVEQLTFRLGVNNAFNRLPPVYAPNVQSGTDPSLYDVIGRRGYVSARIRF